MIIKKKYYVGANKVFNEHTYGPLTGQSWAKETLNEAIDHAKNILDEKPDQDYAFIVKIIKVVRRKRTPIVVETVK